MTLSYIFNVKESEHLLNTVIVTRLKKPWRLVLMNSHTAHMPQPTMCSPVANSQQVAKLACIMLRNVTPGWIRTPDLDY